ncbi:MAG: DNA polymerase III subunit gamma/tau [Myxococcota bacterium]
MSYLAIARKYRPATFDEIVGQDHVTQTLRNAITNDRIHHAYLFCGARGVGKTTAARALAKSLNCEKGPTPTPCGVCASCREIASGSSPDLIEIDGASNNSVDDVRDLRETVHYAPTRGRSKIYLVDEVHMLSKAAFNALLKTLEEPPPHVVFIFATTEPHRILDTILSRVQRFDFKRMPVAVVAERLAEIASAEGVNVEEGALRLIARAGEGSMRDAQSLLDKVISAGGSDSVNEARAAELLGLIDRSLLWQFTEGLVKGQPDACLSIIAKVYDFGHEMSQFTGDLLETVRNATLVGLSESSRQHLDLGPAEVEQLQSMVDGVPTEQLTRIFNALLDVHDQVSRAARPRIVLEMAVARLATTRPVQPVSELLARLEQLERGAGRPTPPSGGRARAGRGGAAPRTSAAGNTTRTGQASPRSPRSAKRSPSSSRDASESDREGSDLEPPPYDGPVPTEDAPAEEPPKRTFKERWGTFIEELKEIGGPAARLAAGDPLWQNGTLTIRVPAGRALAEARRAQELPEVARAVDVHFSGHAKLQTAPLPGTGTPKEHQQALQREVLDDPDYQRIIRALGAEIDTVTSLRDENT